jgi:hypothetical protein
VRAPRVTHEYKSSELYRNEQYKFGSQEREEAEFADHVARVRAVQERLAREHFSVSDTGSFTRRCTRACWGR